MRHEYMRLQMPRAFPPPFQFLPKTFFFRHSSECDKEIRNRLPQLMMVCLLTLCRLFSSNDYRNPLTRLMMLLTHSCAHSLRRTPSLVFFWSVSFDLLLQAPVISSVHHLRSLLGSPPSLTPATPFLFPPHDYRMAN